MIREDPWGRKYLSHQAGSSVEGERLSSSGHRYPPPRADVEQNRPSFVLSAYSFQRTGKSSSFSVVEVVEVVFVKVGVLPNSHACETLVKQLPKWPDVAVATLDGRRDVARTMQLQML
jgi:hypothetical protein